MVDSTCLRLQGAVHGTARHTAQQHQGDAVVSLFDSLGHVGVLAVAAGCMSDVERACMLQASTIPSRTISWPWLDGLCRPANVRRVTCWKLSLMDCFAGSSTVKMYVKQ